MQNVIFVEMLHIKHIINNIKVGKIFGDLKCVHIIAFDGKVYNQVQLC